jgi:hypothetical protein
VRRKSVADRRAIDRGASDRVFEADSMAMLKTPIAAPRANSHNGVANWLDQTLMHRLLPHDSGILALSRVD